MRVALGRNASAAPGTPLAVRPGVLRTKSRASRFANSSAALRLPARVPPPEAVVSAPTRVGGCDALTLDGSPSLGGGGRPLAFRWGVGPGPANRAAVAALLASLPPDQRAVSLPPAALLDGTVYPFALRVRNFAGAEATTAFAVAREAAPVPLVPPPSY